MKTTEAPPDILRQFFLEEFPNPERIGCPPGATLKAAAENRLPVTDPARLHMGGCSECFAEYRGYRLDWQNHQATRRRMIGWAVAAALLLNIGGGTLALRHRRGPAPNVEQVAYNTTPSTVIRTPPPNDTRGQQTPPVSPPKQEDRPTRPTEPHHPHRPGPDQPVVHDEPIPVVLDLAPRDPAQGDPAQQQRKRLLRLRAAELNLSLLLPRSNEPGAYQLQLTHDPEGQKVIASAAGKAVARDGRVSLDVHLPLQSVPAGDYFLSVAPKGGAGQDVYDVRIVHLPAQAQ